jgi:PAS domain S-box-containing protein
MSILVVDDERESRAVLTSVLMAEGYQVNAADGGELALASIAVSRPSLILLDIRMPGMDGFEVCRRLKDSPATRDIPIMFLSAGVEYPERVEGLRLGAVDFVSKPFQREELLARVRTHLELARLRTHLEDEVANRTAELRESESRFRSMADAAPVMIWASNPDKLCNFFNRGWLDFTGRSLEEELGNGWAEGVHPGDQEGCYAAYCSAFDARRSFQLEYRLRRADGEYRWILDNGVPRFVSGGTFAGYIGSCIDVTDFRHSHEKMLAAQKLESLGVMAAGVAHDFGNLLGSIFAEADLALSDMPPDAPGRESVERISGVANYAREIVHLLMTSAGSGVDVQPAEQVDLSYLVEQMLRLMTITISKRAVVRTNLATDLPPVMGSVAQIRQVVINLITNASEALGDNRGIITVATDRVAGTGGQYVRLKISDTGSGMSAETRARIFDQFFTTKSAGRGLGLAAVHGIVRAHKGEIDVVSSPGAGTTFVVLLPAAAEKQKEKSMPAGHFMS